MPRVQTRTSRTDLYVTGVNVPSEHTKSGFRRDRSKPNPDGDTLRYKKGTKYYTWKFKKGGRYYSLTYPKRSQLTQSGFLQQLYDIQDNIGFERGELEASRDTLVEQIEGLRDECEASRENMPYQLQDSGSGELLQERYDALDEWANELQDVDCDVDEDLSDEEKEERIDEIISELENIDCNL